jgi:hypothetical protein
MSIRRAPPRTSSRDAGKLWYFEAVDDNDALIAIRQSTIEADGARHAYSPQHIEDECGFQTDQPIDYAGELTPCSAEQFRQIWDARGAALIGTSAHSLGGRCGRCEAQPMRSASETMIPSGPRT